MTICCTVLILLLARGPCELGKGGKGHGGRLHMFLFNIRQGHSSEQWTILEEFIRIEVVAEAREERLPLGQALESCKLWRGRRCAGTEKDVVAGAICKA